MINENIIIQSDYATLLYHPDKKIVHHIFHKPIGGQPFRDVLLAGLETLKANGAQKWLSDDRANAALPTEDTDWAQSVWFPQVRDAGWKYWALVVPDDIMGRINMVEFTESYFQKGIRIMVFTDPVEAQQWLEAL
jgi:hypothetical protein